MGRVFNVGGGEGCQELLGEHLDVDHLDPILSKTGGKYSGRPEMWPNGKSGGDRN